MQNAELEPRFQGSAQQLFTVGVVVVWGGCFRACAQLRARTATCRVLVLSSEDQHTCAVNENVLAINNIMK